MFFKNLTAYRLPVKWDMTSDRLIEVLSSQVFRPCESMEMESTGWVPPREHGELVHVVNNQFLLTLRAEKKLMPTAVVVAATKERAKEIEEQQGYKVGRKQMKELKEAAIDDLLPRAFSISSVTNVWINPVAGWLVVDSPSSAKCDVVLKLLFKAIDKFPLETFTVQRSPVSAMTEWLASDEAPSGFTVDQDTELQAMGESKATVRYVRHTLEVDDVRRHISAGKQCTRLAMTWNDRVSFVLTDALVLKRVAPLDVLKESEAVSGNNDERFDSDFALMSGEITLLLQNVAKVLGGLKETEVAEI